MTIFTTFWTLVVGAALVNLPSAELDTVKGEQIKGRLASINAEAIVLQSDGNGASASRSVPLGEVLKLRLPETKTLAAPVAGPKTTQVQLVDGSHLPCASYKVANNEATLETSFGKIQIPVSAIQFVRFGGTTEKLDEAWKGILERELKKDVLVVRKREGDGLDPHGGVIGGIDEKIRFLLEGDEIPVAREKVYAVIYVRRAAAARKSMCRLQLAEGEILQVASIAWDGSQMQATLAAGPQITVPLAQVQSLDFSSGKVRYLSQMEPREIKYTPYIDAVWQHLSRDRNLHGGPIRLAGKTYSRGLSIHSRTFLKYRLASDYTRFQALCGIDQLVEGRGDVHLTIRGDGRVLHDAEVRGTDAPVALDLNVSGVRDLEILVDFGRNQDDIADHLDLADAKVTK